MSQFARRTALALLVCSSFAAQAADWSDTSLSYRYGTKYAEPFNNQDISKNIFNLTSVSGYKYGKNFFSVDFLLSSEADPSSAGAKDGAHEGASDTPAAQARSLADAVDDFERSLIASEWHRHGGSLARTAEALNTPKTTLHGKLRRYGLMK